jgi:RimJ/RimL family protein N-acetyltransferase
LTLLVADLSILDAAIAGPDALSRAMGGLEVADGWEVFPEALPAARAALAADPAGARWGTRLFVLEADRTLVGWGGFKGPPADGAVELGYAVAPGFRQRGIATGAVRDMLRDAFSDPDVEAVLAHTLAEPGPSTRVLERTGFAHDGELTDAQDGRLWRWRHERPQRASPSTSNSLAGRPIRRIERS